MLTNDILLVDDILVCASDELMLATNLRITKYKITVSLRTIESSEGLQATGSRNIERSDISGIVIPNNAQMQLE